MLEEIQKTTQNQTKKVRQIWCQTQNQFVKNTFKFATKVSK